MIQTGKNIYKLLRDTYSEFRDDNGTKLSAALAYYTIFSIAPFLLVIISLTGLFFGEAAMQGSIYGQINDLVGKDAAIQIQEGIRNISLSGKTVLGTIIGAGTLLFGASGVFGEIQDSINIIWGFKSKPKRGYIKILINRLLSFSMIISISFLLMVSLILNALIDMLSRFIDNYFEAATAFILLILNNVLMFGIISVLFMIIFKILPDARIKWRHVRAGAFVTALLFMLGKFLIGFYLGRSHIASHFGAAGSVILTMLWVYYNAIILYFGAEFTQVYTRSRGITIHPNRYAVAIEQRIIELKDIKPVN